MPFGANASKVGFSLRKTNDPPAKNELDYLMA
jgi:hypothetical protein